jgi:hypothetical protein
MVCLGGDHCQGSRFWINTGFVIYPGKTSDKKRSRTRIVPKFEVAGVGIADEKRSGANIVTLSDKSRSEDNPPVIQENTRSS